MQTGEAFGLRVAFLLGVMIAGRVAYKSPEVERREKEQKAGGGTSRGAQKGA